MGLVKRIFLNVSLVEGAKKGVNRRFLD